MSTALYWYPVLKIESETVIFEVEVFRQNKKPSTFVGNHVNHQKCGMAIFYFFKKQHIKKNCGIRYAAKILFCCVLYFACNQPDNTSITGGAKDTLPKDRVRIYIEKGNKAYAAASGYQGVEKSMRYFDSAQLIADAEGDSSLLAACDFAKGRVYDAWNKDPQKTIEYYSRAADYYSRIADKRDAYLYLKHLVAHAYDKIQDSANCIRVLTGLYQELLDYDSIENVEFTPKLAHISSEVRNYKLADEILKTLTKREWIKNDSASYNYLDFYYLTKARIDVYQNKNCKTPFLDSLQLVYANAKNTFDSNYFSNQLSFLYAACNNYEKAYRYYFISSKLYEKINEQQGIGSMQNTLLKAELAAEKRRQEYAQKIDRLREYGVYALIGVMIIISAFAYNLNRQKKRYREQSITLTKTNALLDEKIIEVDISNKEIQHRIKNNLQMVYSLLQMQQRQTDNAETVEHLQAAGQRVESIAALHEQLMKSKSGVDFKVFVTELTDSIIKCLSVQKQVTTHLSIEPVTLPANHYFSLSLIFNEWITNSLKYAQSDEQKAMIHLNMVNRNGGIDIEYFDNGKPIFERPEKAGLGIDIMHLLCKQMNATLTNGERGIYHYLLYIPNGK